MKFSFTQIGLAALFILFLIQTLRLEFAPAPAVAADPVPADTLYVTKVDTLIMPADTVFRSVTIYRPDPYHQEPSAEAVPQLVSSYQDTVQLGECEVYYNAIVAGELRAMALKARRTTSRVIRITSTQYIKQPFETKVYPRRLYLGAGMGGNMQRAELAASALLATRRNAYALDYDFINKSVRAKAYIKIF